MSTEQMNRIYESLKMSDENDIKMKASNQLVSNRVNGKSLQNERRVLAPIDTKSTNIITGNNHNKKYSRDNNNQKLRSIVSNQETFKSSKTNFGPNNGQKSSDFTIFCDESDNESNANISMICDEIKAQEKKEQIESCQQTDHLFALNSLAIEEQINPQQTSDQDIRCEESFMFETDEEEEDEQIEDDSISERTSEVSRSFEATALSRCREYANDVHKYLLFYERKGMPDPFYIGKQPEINAKMRSILIDWMVEVTEEYKLLDETLFLAVNYIDRFLSLMSVSRQSFQLLGTAALFIASKYEEIYPPDLGEFVYITDDSYSKHQILNMEKLILKALQFDVSSPTIHYFIEKFASDLALNTNVKHLAKYLCCLTLLESEPFLQYYPSEIAICSIILSAHTLGFGEQVTDQFIQNSVSFESEQNSGDIKNFMAERQACIEALHKMQHFAHKHPQQAIRQRYASDKYYHVSMVEALPVLPQI